LARALLLLAQLVPPQRFARARHVAPRLAAGDLVRGLAPTLDQLAAHYLDLPQPAQGIALAQLLDDAIETTIVGHIEGLALALRERGKLRRGHELVLGATDHLREAAGRVGVARHGVVEEVHECRPQLTQQQALADLIQDVRVLRQPKVRAMVR